MGVEVTHKGTVLIVDDSDDMRALVTLILRKRYNIVEAENGRVALDYLAKHEVDVIILDENMPVMGGHECYKQLRERADTTPVIFCTGLPCELHQKRELQLGAFDYISKPVDPGNLIELVNEAYSAKQRLRNIHARRLLG